MAHLLADILLRVGFFVVTFVLFLAPVSGAGRRSLEVRNDLIEEFYAALVFATFAALFGPWMYRTAAHRGRGTLSQVKKDSERRK